MKNFTLHKKYIFIAIVIILIIILGYNAYPKSGSFNDLVVSKYSEKPFKEIVIFKSHNSKIIKDTEEINKFLAYLNKFELVEYKGKIPNKSDDIYNIAIYDYKDNLLGVTIQNKNYIEVYIKSKKTREDKKYKIVNDSLDIEYMLNLKGHVYDD